MDDGTEAATEPAPTPAQEPVRVGRISKAAQDASDAYGRIHAELSGLVVASQEEFNVFGAQIAVRVKGLHPDVRDHLLVMLVSERLAGRCEQAVVTVPEHILNERVAARS